jgi:hypothetical protein
MVAGVGHHPSVTVAAHAFRISTPGEDAGCEAAFGEHGQLSRVIIGASPYLGN